MGILERPGTLNPEEQVVRDLKIFYQQTPTDAAMILVAAQKEVAAKKNGHSTPTEVAAAIAAEPIMPSPIASVSERADEATFIDPLPEVPAAMKAVHQWVRWNLETRHGKQTKVPYQINGELASSDKPEQWASYQAATTDANIDQTKGVGLMFADGFAGIDLDGCRNPETGDITPWAESIIDKIEGAYVEISPSGTGLHIFVRGVVPGADKKFNLNPAVGYGKAAIEIYDSKRYFTVTGEPYFEDVGDIRECDLTEVYEMFHQLRRDNPAPRNEKAETCDANGIGGTTKIELLGTFSTTKYDIFTSGEIESESPFVISNRLGRLTYPSASEADMAFCTVSAFTHGDNSDAIWDEYTKSALVRDKWLKRKDYFYGHTIEKAIASAAKVKANETPTLLAPETPAVIASPNAVAPIADDNELGIPQFDPSVINGIYKKFVDVATHGTTMTPQFVYAIAKTIVGARMAGKVKFENLDVEPRFYTALIGETGSGKGLAWHRVFQILNSIGELGTVAGIKINNSADSGAGIRDAFFQNPQEAPMLMYVDEVEGLGNKAAPTRNPGIVDAIIELADSTSISRMKADKKGDPFSGSKTKNDARLCAVLCGQDGHVYMKSFAGRTKLGLWDRFYPEYGTPVDPGDLPEVDPREAFGLISELNKLDYSGVMIMAPDAKARLVQFWAEQDETVRKKARWKKHLMVDAFMSAFGRGLKTVELTDAEIAIKICRRQLVIRQACFTNEVPDRTGFYLGLLKKITEEMDAQLTAGMDPALVAKSRRDFEKKTHAHRDNEIHLFERAWNVWSQTYLKRVDIEKANGQKYPKFLPVDNDE
jgi:hypothetical protein